MKRVAQAGGSTAQIAAYTGINKQLVVDTDTHELVVMDGTTQGGHRLAKKADTISQTAADELYLGKTAKAESAKTADTATSATKADSATKATQDGDGNVIPDTYLKKSQITSGTDDLTAGSSPLATGSLYFMYE